MNQKEIMENYIKSRAALRYWLLGRKYIKSVEALDFALQFHNGFRKDKITPEFQHQVYIGNFARVYEPLLIYPEEVFTSIFLHDLIEDYDISKQEIKIKFGELVSSAVDKLSKKNRTFKKNIETYFNDISECPIASVIKGIDRVHNIHTMVGVFSHEGELHYIEETEKYIIPTLYNARHIFHQQEAVYENLKQYLILALDLIKKNHEIKNKNI
ncbi:MAG: hypothetical protein M0Q13_10330 [Methanothrix sp.]|jgi:(p)ppGpp synthase/HD superfamily hydrolase|nr:hypothetical protein [Methanothrix sp.]